MGEVYRSVHNLHARAVAAIPKDVYHKASVDSSGW